jgi:hypothetical protein
MWTVVAFGALGALGAVATVAASVGCGGGDSRDPQNQVYAGLAVQVLDAFDQESALAATFVDDVDVGGTPEEAAAFAAARAAAAWTPEGCAVATVDSGVPARVAIVFGGCTGPFGLVGVFGSFFVEFGRGQDGQLSIQVNTGGSPHIGEWTRMNLRIDGSYVQSGAERHLTAYATGDDQEDSGLTFASGGDYETGWDEGAACRSLDGTWRSTGNGFDATSVATGLVRCAGGCPQSGGSLVFADVAPFTRKVTLAFDGSAKASWVAGDGESGTIDLPCGR